jgi:tRNA threonylcarbamoyladenosine biosynthesis protein TsaB
MWVLALDTTTRGGSAALVQDDRVVVERAGDGGRTHTERLPAELERVLAEAGVAPAALDLLVVASGPGAFTGLRIGLAAIQGLALALDRPVAALSAFEAHAWLALAARPGTGRIGVWLDASRGDVFASLLARSAGDLDWPLVTVQPPTAAPPAEVVASWTPLDTAGLAVVGEGARRHADVLTAAGLRPDGDAPLLAGALGRLGRRAHLAGRSGPPHTLQPLYVRRPDVEVTRERGARP